MNKKYTSLELSKKLNKEYKNIGKISVTESHEEDISVSNIEYVKSIMDIIKPLKIEEPIIVSKYWRSDDYIVIDGYHRLKSKIQDGIKKIKVIVLDKYTIHRKSDTLFNFFENLVGKTVKFIGNEIFMVDGKYYEIKGNEGCGGCSNGWSSIEVLSDFINKNIEIKTVKSVGKDDSDLYDLYINDKLVANVDTGYGNGYYGGDFEIYYRN